MYISHLYFTCQRINISGDNVISQQEFESMAPKLIYGCSQTGSEPVPEESQKSEESKSTDDYDVNQSYEVQEAKELEDY